MLWTTLRAGIVEGPGLSPSSIKHKLCGLGTKFNLFWLEYQTRVTMNQEEPWGQHSTLRHWERCLGPHWGLQSWGTWGMENRMRQGVSRLWGLGPHYSIGHRNRSQWTKQPPRETTLHGSNPNQEKGNKHLFWAWHCPWNLWVAHSVTLLCR